jgi:hypothetical protein
MSAGLGAENEVLDSAEFYDLDANKWTTTSALKVGRTEHVMGLVYGIPTVIGGQFIFFKRLPGLGANPGSFDFVYFLIPSLYH